MGVTLTVVRERGETVYVEGFLEGMMFEGQEDLEARKTGAGQGPVPIWSPQ